MKFFFWKTFSGAALFFMAAIGTAAEGMFFSDKPKLFLPLLAAARDPQVKMSFIRNERGHFFEPAFGGDIGIYYRDLAGEGAVGDDIEKISLVARVLVASRFEFGSGSFDLWNTDFLGGPQWSYRWGNNGLEFWAYHQSSHKGPDITATTGRSINYSFEALRLLYSRFLRPELRAYTGVETVVHGEPKEVNLKSSVRVGGDWHWVNWLPALYVAADFEARQLHSWTVNSAVQIGYELGAIENSARRQHLFVNFFHGYSALGQFFRDRETSVSAGIGLVF